MLLLRRINSEIFMVKSQESVVLILLNFLSIISCYHALSLQCVVIILNYSSLRKQGAYF